MIRIIREWLEAEYQKGYEAGAKAQELKDNEIHVKSIEDALGRGYALGVADAKAEIGEIELEDLDASVFEEVLE